MHCLPTLLHGAPTTLHARTIGPFGLLQVSGTHTCCCNDHRHRFGNLGQGFGTPPCASEDIALRRPLITMNTPPLPLLPLPDHPSPPSFAPPPSALPHFPLLSLFSFSSIASPWTSLGRVFAWPSGTATRMTCIQRANASTSQRRTVVAVMHSLTDAHRHTTSYIRRAASFPPLSHKHGIKRLQPLRCRVHDLPRA